MTTKSSHISILVKDAFPSVSFGVTPAGEVICSSETDPVLAQQVALFASEIDVSNLPEFENIL